MIAEKIIAVGIATVALILARTALRLVDHTVDATVGKLRGQNS